jgi:uncharacterized protein YdaU (DUF1376 family)
MLVRPKLPPAVLDFFKKQGAKGGRIGGKRSLETMTPEERTARAKKAAAKSAEVRRKKAKPRESKSG